MKLWMLLVALVSAQARGQSCISGRVVAAVTDQPIAGAAVSAASAQARDHRPQTTKETTTDSTGGYRLCLTSGGTSVLVQAFIGTASAFRPITIPSSDSTIADLRMPAEGDTGVAIVAGHVISENGTPVVGGTVEILGGRMEAPTDDDGAYGLRGPEGSQVLVVRRIGLGAAVVPVELYARRPRLVNMTMQPALSTLPVVTVVADRLRLAQVYNAIGLTARERDGHGHRLTADQIDAKQAQNAAQLLEGVPGVVLRVNHNNELRAYPTRGTETLNSYGDCTAYVVDGALIGNGHVVYTIDQNGVPQGNEDESVLPRPADLIAVEVYQPNEPSPLADGGVLKCLKVFYWTKAMMGKP